MPADYYQVLGVGSNATEDEIKKAYRRLAREHHPDTNGGDPSSEERFKEITIAYETLKDPERRHRYDVFGPDAARGAGPSDAGTVFGAGGIGDIFDAFFNQGPFGGGGASRQARGGPPPGGDAEIALTLSFAEAVFGARRDVELRLAVACEACDASGASPGTQPSTCPQCQGMGEVRRVRQSILGQMVTASPCGRCGGMGQIIEHPCSACRGDGRRTQERSYTVDVPAGVDTGSTLRLTGRGPVGPRGGPPGDLYVHLRVQEDARFSRSGYDLVHILALPMTQAALGAHLAFDTLDGTEDLVIPRGTPTGKVFRLRGRGVPHVGGRGRGDLLVQVEVVTPDNLTREQEDLLRQLAEQRGEEVAPVDPGLFSRIRSAFK
ncbi:MAG: molecular chaperone DnaJ [Acidimicrobiales bacterium]